MKALQQLSLLSLLGTASATYRGFNLGANRNSDNQCKTVQDWTDDMNAIKAWEGGKFNAVKLYSTAQCNQLDQAAQAAIATGMKIFVGIWSGGGAAAVNAEFTALTNALHNHGHSYIAAVSCGSEDLYRGDVQPQEIVNQINRAKKALSGTGVKVTHTDTWTAWVAGPNVNVIKAVDFVSHNSFPFWEGAASDLEGTFFRALQRTTDAAHAQNAKLPVWVGETGEPSAGQNFSAAIPSLGNLQSYWTNVACELIRKDMNFFWYSAFDAPYAAAGVEQNFGVADKNRKLKIRLDC